MFQNHLIVICAVEGGDDVPVCDQGDDHDYYDNVPSDYQGYDHDHDHDVKMTMIMKKRDLLVIRAPPQ